MASSFRFQCQLADVVNIAIGNFVSLDSVAISRMLYM